MKALASDLVPALRALVVALAGVLLALSWYNNSSVLVLVIVAGLAAVGVATEWFGERFLPAHPVAAVLLMEWWILVPMAVATLASAALIVAAVELAVPETVTDPVVKEAVGAIGTAVSAFLTASFVSSIGDRDKSGIGDRIKERVRRHYARDATPGGKRVRTITPSGHVERLLYSDHYQGLTGWDRETRLSRARGIAAALANGDL